MMYWHAKHRTRALQWVAMELKDDGHTILKFTKSGCGTRSAIPHQYLFRAFREGTPATSIRLHLWQLRENEVAAW